MKRRYSRGITLLELLVAMAIAGMIMSISFPAVTAGLEGIRLQGTARRVGAFLNVARGQADRDQLPVELQIDLDRNRMSASSADGKWERTLELAEGVRLAAVWPAVEGTGVRRFIVIPGVPGPSFRLDLTSARGRSLAVSVDPLTGTPQIEEAPR